MIFLLGIGCGDKKGSDPEAVAPKPSSPYLLVLGTAQDAGAPQLGCTQKCCAHPDRKAKPEPVVSLAFIDEEENSWILFEATPDITSQVSLVEREGLPALPESVFLTHAHIGHYTGLMYFGREAVNASGIPVFTMPRFNRYLRENGPWEQLVRLGNISLSHLDPGTAIKRGRDFLVTPFVVPHRDEYSETVGFKIEGPKFSALFIPDIDKWHLWEQDINTLVQEVDYAFLDATFYNAEELPNRDITQIPHPTVTESLQQFSGLSPHNRDKIYFIHFNHTNPLLDPNSEAAAKVREEGYRIARKGMRFPM